MYFDRLAHTVEHHFPEYVELVQEARLFRVTHAAPSDQHVVGTVLAEWEPETRLVENFRLPFKTIALENAKDRYSTQGDRCILFHTVDAAERVLQFLIFSGSVGTTQRFAAGSCTVFPDGLDQQGRMVRVSKLYAWEIARKKLTRINVSPSLIDVNYKYTSNPAKLVTRSEHEQARQAAETAIAKLMANMLHMTLLVGTLELVSITEPSTFVLEERPLKEETKQGNAIPRAHCRPHYIVLKPQEIRRRLGLSEPTGTTRCPHERRGHWRQLTAERYLEKKKVWVRDSWIGPREAVVGKNRYLVMLDEH